MTRSWLDQLPHMLLPLVMVGLPSCQSRHLPNAESPAGVAPSPKLEPKHEAPPPTIQGLPPEVASLVERLARDAPGDVDSLFIRGRIVELFGQSNEALRCWQECLSLDPGFAPAHERIGLAALNRGEFDEAANHLSQACELKPDLPEARLHLGKVLLKLGRSQEAAEVLERHAAEHPEATEAWFRLGQAQLQTQKFARAKKSYDAALEIDDRCLLAWFGIAQACVGLGEVDRAQECRQRFLELDDERASSDHVQLRARSVEQANQQALALACVIAADDYSRRGSSTDAQTLWRRAAELDPANAQCRQALGGELGRQGRAAEAIVVLEELQVLQPQNVEHLFSLAALHRQLRQFEATEQRLQQIMEIAPENVAAHAGLAQLYLATGQQLPAARRLAERAIQLQPTGEHYFLLSALCLATEDPSGARAALQQAIRLDPRNPKYAEAASVLGKE